MPLLPLSDEEIDKIIEMISIEPDRSKVIKLLEEMLDEGKSSNFSEKHSSKTTTSKKQDIKLS